MHFWTVMVITCNKNCCEAFIKIRWVLIPIAMSRSSGYNPIYCPAISVKLRCSEIPCQVEKVACRAYAWIPDVRDPVFWPAELLEWTCICGTVWLIELAYRACVTDARSPDINSSAVNLREYRIFDVIKSIAIECVSDHDFHNITFASPTTDYKDERMNE